MFVVCLHPPKTSTPECPSLDRDQKFPANLLRVVEDERLWHFLISSSQPPKPALHCSWNVDFSLQESTLAGMKSKKIQAGFAQICLKKKSEPRNVETWQKCKYIYAELHTAAPRKVCQPWENPGRRSKGIWIRAELIHAANPQHHHSQGLLSLPDIPFYSFLWGFEVVFCRGLM